MQTQIKAVLFDVDGTLIDSNELHVSAWEEAFAGIGVSFDRQTVREQMGKGADMLIPTLLPNLDEAATKGLGEAHDKIFRAKYRSEAKPFPAACDLLKRVHAEGQKVVLASSASKADLDHYVDLLDARAMITASTVSDDVDRTKPAPDIFAAALAKLPSISSGDALVVGDTPYDIEAAAKCRIATVALRCGGFSDRILREAGALALYDDAADLLAHFDSSPLRNAL